MTADLRNRAAAAGRNRATAASDDAEGSAETAPGHPKLRARFTALVAEDNILIAMAAEEALRELGAAEVQVCLDVASALGCVRAGSRVVAIDVALLDVNLGGETSDAIAIALRQSGIPFIVTTGFGDYISDIAAYAGAPVLTKPYTPAALVQALAQIMI